MHTLIPQQRSPGAAAGGLFTAVVFGGMTAALALDPALSTVARLTVGSVGVLTTLAFLVTSWRLASPRGGLALDPEGRRLGIGLTGTRDTWWLSLDRLRGLHVFHHDVRQSFEEYRFWTAALDVEGSAPVVLAEGPDYGGVRRVADELAEAIGVAVLEGEAPDDHATLADAGDTSLAVNRGAAMQGVLLTFGLSLTAIGGAFFSQLQVFPVVGLFVAPVMALIGVALVGVVVVKRYGSEELAHEDGRWTHRFRLGSKTWGERSVHCKRPRWRVRLQAIKGACLEIVADDGILLMGAGATTQSRLDIDALSRLPERFATSPAGTDALDPPPSA